MIIPASNQSSRHTGLLNIQNWAKQNNLSLKKTLNCSKSSEILFPDTRRRRRRHTDEPPPLPGIACCSTLKMLGVAIGNDFSGRHSACPATRRVERTDKLRTASPSINGDQPRSTPWILFTIDREFVTSANKNSSGDEIANVLVNDDIAHT